MSGSARHVGCGRTAIFWELRDAAGTTHEALAGNDSSRRESVSSGSGNSDRRTTNEKGSRMDSRLEFGPRMDSAKGPLQSAKFTGGQGGERPKRKKYEVEDGRWTSGRLHRSYWWFPLSNSGSSCAWLRVWVPGITSSGPPNWSAMERGCKCELSKLLTSAGMTGSRSADSLSQVARPGIPVVPHVTKKVFEHLLAKPFIILIYSQYADSVDDTMHLKSPSYDLDVMTRCVQSLAAAAQCRVYVLTDCPVSEHEKWFQYKRIDDTNARRDIIATIQEAGQTSASGMIFYGGHGGRDDQGAYLLPRPGNKIYGKDIVSVLPDQPKASIGCVFDACCMGTFFDISTVPCLMTINDGIATCSGAGMQTGGQLIVISATKEDQKACVIRLKQQPPVVCSHGLLLGCLLHHIRWYRTEGVDPSKLIADLQLDREQEPFIASRRPVTSEDFLQLPLFRP